MGYRAMCALAISFPLSRCKIGTMALLLVVLVLVPVMIAQWIDWYRHLREQGGL